MNGRGLVAIHRWLGAICLIPLAWIAGTGCALAIVAMIERSGPEHRLPDGKSVSASQPQALEAVLVAAARGGKAIRSVAFPSSGRESLRIAFQDGERQSFVPGTSAPYFARKANETDWASLLMRAHRGQFAGIWGRVGFSLCGLAFISLTLSALALPQRDLRRSPHRIRHRAWGWGAASFLAFLSATGSVWNLSRELRPSPFANTGDASAPCAWPNVLAKSASLYANSAVESLHSGNSCIVIFRDGARLTLREDAASLSVPWTFRGWLEPMARLHALAFAGEAGPWLVLLGGGLALGSAATGAVLLFRRHRRRWPASG